MKSLRNLSTLLVGGLLLGACQKQSIEPQLPALDKANAQMQNSNGQLQNRNFSAHLTGDQEVPVPVETNATGQATFKLSKDGASLSYKLIVANIETVRFGHLHLGKRGVNGPVIVDLVGRTAPSPQGVIAEGIITAASIKGPSPQLTFAQLIAAMENEEMYVNVHSDRFPGGEIRGQVR
jgi:hypothetical protein